METPLGLKDQLREIAEKAKDGLDLYQTILTLPPAEMVEFFEDAADSQSWVESQEGHQFMVEMSTFFTKAALKHTFSLDHLTLVARAIRRNHRFLAKIFPEDLVFIVQGVKYKANSLMFRIFGESYFSNLIDDYVVDRNQKEIILKGVSKRVFEYIKEFFYTEKMDTLWKEEPKVILALQKRGNYWRLRDVSDYAFKTYKNYINQEVLFKRLVAAFSKRNIHLTEELLSVLEKESFGFNLKLIHESGFQLELIALYEEIESFLKPLLKWVLSITLNQTTIDEEPFKMLLRKCPNLESIDLSNFRECQDPVSFIQTLPPLLHSLNLTDLSWVNGETIQAIVDHLQNLRLLNLSGCENYQPTLLSEISKLKELDELDLTNNQSLTTPIMKIVVPLFKSIKRLNLTNCQGVNDEGLQIIAHDMWELEEIRLVRCRNVTEKGILALTARKKLRLLDLREMAQIPANFKERNQRHFFRVDILV